MQVYNIRPYRYLETDVLYHAHVCHSLMHVRCTNGKENYISAIVHIGQWRTDRQADKKSLRKPIL